MGQTKIRVGALISGGGTNLQAIIDASLSSRINAELVFVGTDNPSAKGLLRAEKIGIPAFITDYSAILNNYKRNRKKISLPPDFNLEKVLSRQRLFKPDDNPEKIKTFLCSRALAEADLIQKMSRYPFDLLVLAGFMRTLTPYFIDTINIPPESPRIMNIHPAILPAFPGSGGYGETFRYGCKVGGCTVHFIDYGEDSGPIIGQSTFPIEPSDTIDRVKEKGLKLEWELYPQCIQLFSEGRLQVVDIPMDERHKTVSKKRIVKILPD
ncbi:MAG: phosphoribosylglycinamide formyltransferase [Proteobacteria bacterium]|nr:phosphoribosylglycinamide formyltransferase [Pseudomonadota bacterium]